MEAAVIATAVSILGSAYYTKANADRQKKAIKRSNAYAAEQAALQNKQAKLALQERQRKNKNLLAQQQAAYKARLGATGLSAQSGTGQTYLNAMQKEYDMEDKYLINQAKISSDALLNSLNHSTGTNLLKLNSINQESQNNIYGTLGDLVGGISRTMIK